MPYFFFWGEGEGRFEEIGESENNLSSEIESIMTKYVDMQRGGTRYWSLPNAFNIGTLKDAFITICRSYKHLQIAWELRVLNLIFMQLTFYVNYLS